MAERESGFLGRWSQRKAGAVQGKPLPEPVDPQSAPVAEDVNSAPEARAQSEQPAGQVPQVPQAPPPPPSLEDAAKLTRDSDFKPFMAGDVSADVRNAAMKKLFSDPHFNVMDGLDIYIDDYSISEPIPESMLRQMASAKFLKLFDEDPEETDEAARATDDLVAGKTSVETVDDAPAPQDNDANPPESGPPASDAGVLSAEVPHTPSAISNFTSQPAAPKTG
jgi:hypothetical protein